MSDAAQPLPVMLDNGKAACALALPTGAVFLAVREAWDRASAVQLYSAEEVAEIFGVSVRTIWSLVSDGQLAPTYLVGRQRRIPEQAVARYLEARRI